MVSTLMVAGIDVGSTAIKLCLYDGQKIELFTAPTGWNPGAESRALIETSAAAWKASVADLAFVVGTGYGRVCLDFINKDITEITCHARGAKYLHKDARTIIDVGGQDAKAMLVDEHGRVDDFIMNDKCAAGTGRFMQIMANRLGLDVTETGNIKLAPDEPGCVINSMCTVFAESEIVGLINRGFSRTAVIFGLIESIAGRIVAMAARIRPEAPVVFTGGMAHNEALRKALAKKLELEVIAHQDALYAGAIGAALIAWDNVVAK